MMREIQVQMPGMRDSAGCLILHDDCEARLSSMLRGGVTVQIAGAMTVDRNDHIVSLMLAPEPVKGAVAPHTELQVDGHRVAYNPSTSDRLAYLTLLIGESRRAAESGDSQRSKEVLDLAANYIRGAACERESKT